MATANAEAMLKKFKKDMGDSVGRKGVEVVQVGRIPTGIFPLDLALGGGIPRGRFSMVWGNESCGKTALSYLLMKQVQKEGKKAVYIDAEFTFDPSWAVQFGLDLDELIVINPAFAEQAVDIVEGFLYAGDVGIVVIDSIASLTTDNEVASSAEKMNVGGNSYIVGKMVRKAVIALSRESSNKHYPAVFCINQTRSKIGQMFGNPDTYPGGNSLRFAMSLILKLYGKDEIVKEINEAIPTFKAITGQITKHKMPIQSKAFEYSLCMLPHGTLSVGQAPTWGFVATYCKNAGLMTQAGQGKPWKLMGKEGATQKELKAIYETDEEFRQAVHAKVIELESTKGAITSSDDDATEFVDPETGEITDIAA